MTLGGPVRAPVFSRPPGRQIFPRVTAAHSPLVPSVGGPTTTCPAVVFAVGVLSVGVPTTSVCVPKVGAEVPLTRVGEGIFGTRSRVLLFKGGTFLLFGGVRPNPFLPLVTVRPSAFPPPGGVLLPSLPALLPTGGVGRPLGAERGGSSSSFRPASPSRGHSAIATNGGVSDSDFDDNNFPEDQVFMTVRGTE
jgi:hypothetical protein